MISFIKVVCSRLLLFVVMFLGSTNQAFDAIPEVDPAKLGASAPKSAALDGPAQRYAGEGSG